MKPRLVTPSADPQSVDGRRHLTLIRGGAQIPTTAVGIVARWEIVRMGVRALLETDDRIAVAGEAGSAGEAVALAGTLGAGVVLLELTADGIDGVAATRMIVERSDAHVLLVARYESDERVLAALLAGASGVVTDAVAHRELVRAVHAVARGRAVLMRHHVPAPCRVRAFTGRRLREQYLPTVKGSQ